MAEKKLKIPESTLMDLCSRFLLNIPSSEKDDMVRLCFQIELAHWFYLDFYKDQNPELPDCRVREFAKLIFENFSFLLKPPDADVEQILDDWREYKHSVPTYGAALFDESLKYVLLVQGVLTNSSWGFPKGKVNKDELPAPCAIREVKEETGFNIKPFMDEERFIELYIHEQSTRLYIVLNVPLDTKFIPQTRGEIGNVKWFALSDLPEHKRDPTPKQNLNMNPNSFFMVIPFVKQLRKWLTSYKTSKKSIRHSDIRYNTTPKRQIHLENGSQRKHRVVNDSAVKGKSNFDRLHEEQRIKYQQANREHYNSIKEIINTTNENPSENVIGRRSRRSQNNTPSKSHTSNTVNKGRGSLLNYDFQPEAWKNFKLDYESIIRETDKLLKL